MQIMERDPVGVLGVGISPSQAVLFDDGRKDRHGRRFDQAVEIAVEPVAQCPVGQQDSERSLALADVMFVEDNRVVPPHVELETLNGGTDAGNIIGLAHGAEHEGEDGVLRVDGDNIIGLAHGAEHEGEDGVLRVDGDKSVIATFIGVND